MAVTKKIKRAPAKRGRPAKAKTAVRRGRPPGKTKAKTRARTVAKPVKRLTRLQMAEIAMNEAHAEAARAQKVYGKALAKLLKAQDRVRSHQDREAAKKALIPSLDKIKPAEDDGFYVAA